MTTIIRNMITACAAGLAMLALTANPVLAGLDISKILSEIVVEGEYEDVRFGLDDAIVSRGLTITEISNVSAMLQRTAGVVADAKTIFKTGQQFQFCSAVLSRRTMEADPANIVFCPYMVFIYERADAPGQIHIGFRRLNEVGSEESRKALAAVNALLMEIITEASGN